MKVTSWQYIRRVVSNVRLAYFNEIIVETGRGMQVIVCCGLVNALSLHRHSASLMGVRLVEQSLVVVLPTTPVLSYTLMKPLCHHEYGCINHYDEGYVIFINGTHFQLKKL
ncbi:hypothetical protein C0J52_15491 [Blattella germanica]|nr:hypothetical protein C0J52_15491 [Blattella germanica]